MRRVGADAPIVPEERDVRVLGAEKRQRAVVEHRVDDDSPCHAAALGAIHAQAAPGMQQATLLGAEGRGFLEGVPVAARLLPFLLRGCVLGQVQGNAADKRAVG